MQHDICLLVVVNIDPESEYKLGSPRKVARMARDRVDNNLAHDASASSHSPSAVDPLSLCKPAVRQEIRDHRAFRPCVGPLILYFVHCW